MSVLYFLYYIITELTNKSEDLIPEPVEPQQPEPKQITKEETKPVKTKNPKRVAAGKKLAARNKEYKEWLKKQDVAEPHEVDMQDHVQQSAVNNNNNNDVLHSAGIRLKEGAHGAFAENIIDK